MEDERKYAFLTLLLLLLIFFNCLISRDIYNWVPMVRQKISLFALVWLVPVIGLFLANKYGMLGWFKKHKSEGGDSTISQGFMEADSVFNPGMKHRIEMLDKQKSEIHQECKQPGQEFEDEGGEKNT